MKILAIVVTYYPEKNLLKKNINAFIEYVDKVLIWENTPESEKLSFRFIHDEKIEYCGDGINSISHALNYGWKYAKRNGYDYLLTMDQDSILVNLIQNKKNDESLKKNLQKLRYIIKNYFDLIRYKQMKNKFMKLMSQKIKEII